MLLILLFDLLTFLAFNYLAYSFLAFKYNRKFTFFIFIIAYFCICLTNFNGINSSKAIILFFIDIIYTIIQFKGSFFEKCFTIIPFFAFQIFSEIFVGHILINVLSLTVPKQIFSFSYLLGLCLSYILLVIFNLCYIKLSKYIKNNDIPKYTWIIFIAPLITILLLVSENDYFKTLKDFPQYGMVLILFILSNILNAFILFLIVRSTNIKADLKLQEHKAKTLELKYQLVSQHYLYNFNFLHELLHCYTDINNLIDNHEYNKVKEKVNTLMDDTYKEFNSIYSNSIVLNYLINERLQYHKNNHIHCTTIIEDEKINQLDIDVQYNLFAYILNIAENQAIYFETDQRIIIFKSKTLINNLVIQCIIPNKNIDTDMLRKQLDTILKDYKCIINISPSKHSKLKILINFID